MDLPELRLDDLAARVEREAGPDGLGRLDAALTLAAMLNARGDEVAQHFVQLARSDGHSWTAIGERLGVSKQAARERFGGRFDLLSASGDLVPTVRLGACMTAAAVAAKGSPVRTDHQLLGLFQDGVGAAVLERLGLTRDAVGNAAAELEAEIAGPEMGLSDDVEARRTIERASHLARQAGHDHLGTEHVLAALILDPGSRARRVLQRLAFDIPAAKRELDQCLKPRRVPRRRGRHQGSMVCAFCGKQRRDGVRLVAGPGVCICEDCVRLAQDIIAEQPAGWDREHGRPEVELVVDRDGQAP